MSQSAAFWLEKARKARAMAARMRDPAMRRTMLEIAERYERLATHAALLTGQPRSKSDKAPDG
jgi:hypothetical protein